MSTLFFDFHTPDYAMIPLDGKRVKHELARFLSAVAQGSTYLYSKAGFGIGGSRLANHTPWSRAGDYGRASSGIKAEAAG